MALTSARPDDGRLSPLKQQYAKSYYHVPADSQIDNNNVLKSKCNETGKKKKKSYSTLLNPLSSTQPPTMPLSRFKPVTTRRFDISSRLVKRSRVD